MAGGRMKLTVDSQDLARVQVDLLALPLPSLASGARLPARAAALDRVLGGSLAAAVKCGDFRGRRGEQLLVYGRDGRGPRRVLLLGVGEDARLDAEVLRQTAGRAIGQAGSRGARSVAIALLTSRRTPVGPAARALAEGAVLAAYRSDAWRTSREDDKPPVARATLLVERQADLPAAREAAELGTVLAECQNLARRLSNEPPNVLTPEALAREARKVANEVGLSVRVLDVAEMRRRKMGALLGVGQGSQHPPRLIVLEHK